MRSRRGSDGGSRTPPTGEGSSASASRSVAHLLGPLAASRPTDAALVVARTGERLTFARLDDWSDRLAYGMSARGVRPGSRALVLLRPGCEFVAVSFALLKMGALPVFLDPGLGRRNLLRCVAAADPFAVIAARPLHALRPFLARSLRGVGLWLSPRPTPGATLLAEVAASGGRPGFPIAPATDETPAVIAFTSGATGAPKGVVLSHGGLRAQAGVLRETWGIGEGSVQLAILPLLALLGPALGCTSVLPDMDPSRPASADPGLLLRALSAHRVTHAFGSPTVWEKIAGEAHARGLSLPDLRTVLVGGAPVPPGLLASLGRLLTAGRVWTAFGATEAITVCAAPGQEVLEAAADGARDRGTLVGRPVGGVEVRVVRIDDGPLEGELGALGVPAGEVGEIVVRGPLVTAGYDRHDAADRLARIAAPDGDWRRMGDLGRVDDAGRLWFCGRKSERVETAGGRLFTGCVEPLLEHGSVRRLALIGLGPRPLQRAAVVVEPRSRAALLWPPARRRIVKEILARANAHPAARAIERVFFRRALPLDPRHAAKILRLELAAWAGRRAP